MTRATAAIFVELFSKPNTSSTWTNIGLYGLVLTEEAVLGYSGNANFGYDNLTLGGSETQVGLDLGAYAPWVRVMGCTAPTLN